MPGGRPSKFDDVDLELVRELALQGKTDEEMSAELEVSRSTLALWKVRHQDFSDALNCWKGEADDAVESTLYRKALAGDTTAMIFWLKNRRSRDWRDKIDHEHGVTSELASILTRVDGRTREIRPTFEIVG